MAYYSGFPEYVTVAEKRQKAQKAVEKLRKKQPDIAPVVISGRKLARTWWGESWNLNLERYGDYANRIGRGRSYVRHGAVLDLQITQGKVSALVQGSSSKPYKVSITIQPLDTKTWQVLTTACAGKIHTLQELLEGKFPKDLAELFTVKGKGLFPSPKEIAFDCSCPDWAYMCKHVAAVLYGIGARLDENPALFFTMRQVNIDELISSTLTQKSQNLLEKAKTKSRRVIEASDLSDMFGIELGTDAPKKRS